MAAGYVETAARRRRADAGLWVSLSDGGEELKMRDAVTNGVTGKELLREAEEFGRAERSTKARVAGRSQGSTRASIHQRTVPTFRGPLSRLEKKANGNFMRFNKWK